MVMIPAETLEMMAQETKDRFAAIRKENDWQSIETAPRDGTEIMGIFCRRYDADTPPTVYGPWTVAFKRNRWCSSWDGSHVIEHESDFGTTYKEPDIDPTHWRPMPSPPAL